MTIEKFYEILALAVQLDKDLKLQSSLESIRDHLSNITNAPAQPSHQSGLAASLAEFLRSAEELGSILTPAQLSAFAEIGGEESFDPAIATKVKESISTNAMTPSVARDFVTNLASRRSEFLATVRTTLDGLRSLHVNSVSLQPGTADLAFLIPRDIFDDQLGAFAKELTFITRLIENYGEALTSQHEPVLLESLSSSVPLVAIGAGIGVIMYLAKVVNQFLEAWEKIERIRKIRAELHEMGIKGAPAEVLDKQITSTIRTVVDESVKGALENYSGESTRRNELQTALSKETIKLFRQIEKGLTIQFRAEPKSDAPEEQRLQLERIDRLGHIMKFPKVQGDQLLLSDGEVEDQEDEGETDKDRKQPGTTSTRRIRTSRPTAKAT